MNEKGHPPGGIERSVMRRLPQLAVDIQSTQYVVRPEDQARTEEFYASDTFYLLPFDNTIRVNSFGDIRMTFGRSDTQNQIENKRVVYLVSRVNRNKDIDTALRSLGHVISAYSDDGQISTHVDEAVKCSNEMLRRFQTAGLTDEELDSMQKVAIASFSPYTKSVLTRRQRVAEQHIKAAGPDKRGQINPPRSRLMIAQTREDLARERFLHRRIKGKNERRYLLLKQEREYERLRLSGIGQEMERIAGNGTKSLTFERDIRMLRFRVRDEISRFAIRVRPYVQVATLVRFALSSDRSENAKIMLQQFVTPEQAEMLVGEIPAFQELDDTGKIDTLQQLGQIINDALEQSNKRLTTSSTDLLFEETQ